MVKGDILLMGIYAGFKSLMSKVKPKIIEAKTEEVIPEVFQISNE